MSYFITEDCIGCTLCSKYCPVDAITGNKKEKHTINELRCVECGVCGKVCPKSALLDNNKQTLIKVPKGKWLKPVINSKECSSCSICVDICKFECIQITKPKFVGDINVHAYIKKEKECVGCSMCSEACPLNLIDMKG
ncbi:MAG: 4Fe-4S binding protein [Clostridium sp.]